MTVFDESKIRRSVDGKFAHKTHTEADIGLGAEDDEDWSALISVAAESLVREWIGWPTDRGEMTPVVLVDPKAGQDFSKLVRALGGQVFSLDDMTGADWSALSGAVAESVAADRDGVAKRVITGRDQKLGRGAHLDEYGPDDIDDATYDALVEEASFQVDRLGLDYSELSDEVAADLVNVVADAAGIEY